jgi:hypothetical protein
MRHQNRHVSTESAAQSPLARYLRRCAPVGSLFTVYSEDVARDMGYSRAHPHEVVIAMFRELVDLKVIEYVAERGQGASIAVRVLVP